MKVNETITYYYYQYPQKIYTQNSKHRKPLDKQKLLKNAGTTIMNEY